MLSGKLRGQEYHKVTPAGSLLFIRYFECVLKASEIDTTCSAVKIKIPHRVAARGR